MSERRSALGLLARQTRTDGGLLALLAVVVAASAALLTAGPLALATTADDELHTTVSGFDPTRRDLTGRSPVGDVFGRQPQATASDIAQEVDESLAERPFDEPLNSLLGEGQWRFTSTEEPITVADAPIGEIDQVRYVTNPDWASAVAFTSGAAPGEYTEAAADALEPVPVAVSEQAATTFHLAVGQQITSPAGRQLVVTGVYAPVDDGDPFWQHTSDALEPGVTTDSLNRVVRTADVFVDLTAIRSLVGAFSTGTLDYWYPLHVDELRFDQAGTVAAEIRKTSAVIIGLPTDGDLVFTIALAGDLDAIVARVGAASSVLALIAAGPLGVMLAVIALGVRGLLQRRARALELARARGATGWSLALTTAVEGALVALPAAALGAGAAVLLLGRQGLSLWPAALVGLAVPVLLGLGALPQSPVVRRFRWVVEVIVVGLAVAASVVLVRRGPATTDGADPLISAAPLLVAAAVTIGVLRLYPAAMRGLQRALHRQVGPVAVVGAARATRAPALGFAAAFALVVGLAIATFSTTLLTTVVAAFAAAASSRDATFGGGHPLAVLLLVVLALGIAVPLVFTAAAVAIAAVAASRGRGSAVGVLRVLGFSGGQVRRLVGWEFAPVAILAGVVGALLGIGLVVVLGGALDLPGLLGQPVALVLDPRVVAAVLGLFAVAIAVTAALATAAAERRSAASTVRMGAE